jgi:hypothetical protein
MSFGGELLIFTNSAFSNSSQLWSAMGHIRSLKDLKVRGSFPAKLSPHNSAEIVLHLEIASSVLYGVTIPVPPLFYGGGGFSQILMTAGNRPVEEVAFKRVTPLEDPNMLQEKASYGLRYFI